MSPEQRQPATSAPPRESPIAPSQVAPDFCLPAITSKGDRITVDLKNTLPQGRVLLLFYQDDGMPICTSQLKAFAQEHKTLAQADIQTFGINTNGLGSHERFQERDHYPFPLISDFFGEVIQAYGLWDHDTRRSRRALVLIERDGRVLYVEPHFNPGNLAAFEALFAALGLT
ncbi:MAG: hypothetical protein CL897_01020 [Dehalococcoidia bacterium]|nr:hypothetical protein [Dehalococcoidia bacterium]